MLPRLLIVDGSSLLHESFYGTIPENMKREKDRSKWHLYYHELMRTKSGIFTNGVYTAMNRLEKILEEQHFTHLAVTLDITDNTFRKKMYPEYKGNRDKSDECFTSQKILFQELLQGIGFPVFTSNDYEADDLIGSLSAQFKNQIPVVILSGDKDMTQLVDNNVQLWYSCKKKEQAEQLFWEYTQGEESLTLSQFHLPDKIFPLTKDTVSYMMGVRPDQVPELKALCGDSSDNYPGVAGIGEKGAIALLHYFHSLDRLFQFLKTFSYDNSDTLKEFKEQYKKQTGSSFPLSKLTAEKTEETAYFYRKLSTIVTNLSFPISLDDLQIRVNSSQRLKWYEHLEFYSLIRKSI